MKTFYDYESIWRSFEQFDGRCPQLESFRGVDVIRWHGQIERSLLNFIEKYEGARNYTYVDKLRAFLQLWRDNKFTGSINRENIEVLLGPAEILAVDNWKLNRFFLGIVEGLRVILASEEELPRVPGMKPPIRPRLKTDFGAEKQPENPQ